MSWQEGASDADLRILRRYRFKQTCGNGEKASTRAGSLIPIAPTNRDPANKRALLHEDAVTFFSFHLMMYSICFLSFYENLHQTINFHNMCGSIIINYCKRMIQLCYVKLPQENGGSETENVI